MVVRNTWMGGEGIVAGVKGHVGMDLKRLKRR